MLIRTFDPATDREPVVSLWQHCRLTVPWNDPYRDIERKLKVQPELFLVGEMDDRLVASIMAGYDGHRGWLYYLAVDPGYHGRGFGRAIVSEAERLLDAMGCPKVNLMVRTSNTQVADFYRRLGYRADEVVGFGKRLEQD